MNQPEFALDLEVPGLKPDHRAIIHVRADTYEDFEARLYNLARLAGGAEIHHMLPGLVGLNCPPRYAAADYERLHTPAVPANGSHAIHVRAGSLPPAPPEDPELCPDHGTAKASKFGGLYCPAQISEDGDYCHWTAA